MSIQKRDISEAAGKILEKDFEYCEVYSDETQEGFEYPAFFIEIVSRTENESKNLKLKRITIIITYLPEVHTALNNMDVSDKIEKAFGLFIPVKNRKLKIQDIDFRQTGENKEILQAYIKLEYYEAVEHEETHEKMQELIYRDRGSVKNNGVT